MTIESVFDRHARDERLDPGTGNQEPGRRDKPSSASLAPFSSRRYGDSILALCPHRGCAGAIGVFYVVTDVIPLRDWRVIRSPCRRPLNAALNVTPRTVWIFSGFFSPIPLYLSLFSCNSSKFVQFVVSSSAFTHDALLAMVVQSAICNLQFAICNSAHSAVVGWVVVSSITSGPPTLGVGRVLL